MKQLSILLLLVTFRLVTFGQVYQEMPQYGYRANRMAFDSTLQIPTFCGVPTLRSLVKANKNGAIAFDSCNNKLYQYNPKTLTWSEISGGTSIDTTSLSNRINLKIDSLKRSNDSVFAWISGTRFFQYTDSVGDGGGDFWKINGITDLTGNVKIQSDSKISFNGIDNELPRFQVNSDSIIFTNSGNGYTYFTGLNSTTDTSTYKPLGIDIYGQLAPLTSWVSGGGGLPSGGSAGQILTKVDSTDYNATWQDNYADWTSQVKHIVKNNGSGLITKGTAVYVTNSNGTNMLVGKASNASEATSSKTMGLMQTDITTTGGTQTGFVITEGLLGGLNTQSATAGDPVWLGVNGALIYGLANKPYAPAHLVFIGIVTKVSSGNGEIFVKVQNGFELKEIHDMDLITNTPVHNDIVVYDTATSLWKNKSVFAIADTSTKFATKSNIALKLNISDTSAFQRKSIPSYTFLANNTTSTANAQALTFKDTSGTYTGTIAWGSSAPTGATNHSYRWTRIGNMVTLNISLVYGTASSGNTQVTIALPSDAPTPAKPVGTNSASAFLYPATCVGGSTLTASTSVATNRGGIRNNSSNNGFEINMAWTSASTFIYFQTSVTYFTN